MSLKNWNTDEIIKEKIVLTSKISVSRNFKGIKFVEKINVEEAKAIISDVYNILAMSKNVNLIKFGKCNDAEIKEETEKYFISDSILTEREKVALLICNEENFNVLINNEDHIKIECISDGLNLEDSYRNADRIDDIIEDNKVYEFHEKYGYLTASPNILGTGVKASVILHLPAIAITDSISSLSKELSEQGVTIKGIYKDGEINHGNIFEVSNKVTLGINEEEIISNLQLVVLNIIKKERISRGRLIEENNIELQDKIFRAYGILKYARILTKDESLDLLSLFILGAELDLFEIDKEKLNNIFTLTRDFSIKDNFGIENIDYQRSNLVRNILK